MISEEDDNKEKKSEVPVNIDSPDSFYNKYKSQKAKSSSTYRYSSDSKYNSKASLYFDKNEPHGCIPTLKRSKHNCMQFIRSKQMT